MFALREISRELKAGMPSPLHLLLRGCLFLIITNSSHWWREQRYASKYDCKISAWELSQWACKDFPDFLLGNWIPLIHLWCDSQEFMGGKIWGKISQNINLTGGIKYSYDRHMCSVCFMWYMHISRGFNHNIFFCVNYEKYFLTLYTNARQWKKR